MTPRIAIPEPTSFDTAYNQQTLPRYIQALQSAGAIPVPVPLHETQQSIARLLTRCQGVLFPGSKADIDPEAYGESAIPECNPADSIRQAADELLLQDAFNLKKPILAICYGIQALNVWRSGTLLQNLSTPINHAQGAEPTEAHEVKISEGSRLSALFAKASDYSVSESKVFVNSSHHQAVGIPGGGLLVTARSISDNVIEAVELDASDHFVLGVQWHPERTYTTSAASRALFAGFVSAASNWKLNPIQESVASE